MRGVIAPGRFRLALALVVVVHHLSRVALGSAAVELFFVLSGYWLTTMWRDRYARARAPLATYLVSRAWRLWPVFLLASVATVAALPLFGQSLVFYATRDGWPHLILSSLLIVGYQALAARPLTPAWSLDVEVQFALALPVLAWALRRVGGTAFTAGAVVVTVATNLLLGDVGLPVYVAFFALGMAATEAEGPLVGDRVAIGLAMGSALLLGVVALSPWRGVLLGGTHKAAAFALNPALNVVTALLWTPYALATTRRPTDAADHRAADLSYGVYLLHWIAVLALERAGMGGGRRLAWTAVAIGLVFAAAWIVRETVDRPLNRRRARWVRARIAAADPTAR